MSTPLPGNAISVMKFVIHSFLSIAVFLLTLEVCARLDDKFTYGAPFLGAYSGMDILAYDNEGVRYNIPNSQFERWKINRLGFRGEDVPEKKPDGVRRIVCIGASETFGSYERAGVEWPAQLRRILSRRPDLQVMNGAVVGTSLKQYKKYIEKYVLKIEPDVVIIFINPFDYALADDIEGSRVDSRIEQRTSGLRSSIFSLANLVLRSRFIPKIKQAIKNSLPPIILKRYQIWNLNEELLTLEKQRLKGKKPLDSVPEKRLVRFQKDLEYLLTYLLKNNIKVVVSTYPVLISKNNLKKKEYEVIFLDNRRFMVELSLDGIVDASARFNYVIGKVASELGVGLVDICSVMPKNKRYFADTVHYTDEGARLIAYEFADYIQKNIMY